MLDEPWQRSRQVGLRPEPFGALAYHFVTRRLVFLKTPDLVDLVEDLENHDTVADALAHAPAIDSERSRRSHLKALESLAESGVIEPNKESVT